MATPKPKTFFDYLRAAFNARPRIAGLGAVPLNWLYMLGTGVLGLVNPGFWIMGGALELAYLTYLSHHPRFRNLVDASAVAEAAVDSVRRKAVILEQLEQGPRKRYQALEARCTQAMELAAKLSLMETQPLDSHMEEALSRLTWIFLRLLLTRQICIRQLNEVKPEDLEAQMHAQEEQLKKLTDASKDRLRKTLENTVEILRRRLDNWNTAKEHVEFINAELERIDQQVSLMVGDIGLQKDLTSLLNHVDSITSTLNETNDWIKMNAHVFGDIQEQLDDAPAMLAVERKS